MSSRAAYDVLSVTSVLYNMNWTDNDIFEWLDEPGETSNGLSRFDQIDAGEGMLVILEARKQKGYRK